MDEKLSITVSIFGDVGGVPCDGTTGMLLTVMPEALSVIGSDDELRDHKNWKLLPGLSSCGKADVSERIIGGSSAKLGQYPWMVALIEKFENGTNKFHCGGSLINENHVLTAAHCLRSPLNFVTLGEYDLSKTRDCEDSLCAPASTEHRILKRVHPKNVPNMFKNDIALIKFQGRATYHRFVQPICLPQGRLLSSYNLNGSVTVAGWGVTDKNPHKSKDSSILQHVDLPVISLERCQKIYPYFDVDENQYCIDGKDRASCHGDSGGPVMKYIPNGSSGNYFQFGIVSFGIPRCGYYPDVYVRVQNGVLNYTEVLLNHGSFPTGSVDQLKYHRNWKLLPGLSSCGKIDLNERIVGGTTPKLGQYPWMAALIEKHGKYFYFFCGGTLINENHVLTAAHCLIPEVNFVRLGEHDWNALIDCEGYTCAPVATDYRILNKIKHSGYQKSTHKHDIALIKFEGRVTYHSKICSSNLLTARAIAEFLPPERSSDCSWLGKQWSKSFNIYIHAAARRSSGCVLKQCREIFASPIDEYQYCVGTKGKDTCVGDSGGPLMKTLADGRSKKYFLLG
nr:unnamed protein product [Callosobruchus analis]